MKNIGSYPNVRLRRNRKTDWSRRLVQENKLSANDLIWPIFICDGNNEKQEISSMPGVFRYSIDRLNEVIDETEKNKINLIAIFPYTPEERKTENAEEALNPENLVCKALSFLKSKKTNFGVMCDIALDPYTSHGHDGLINNDGIVLNDETNKILVEQSLLFANAGADVIAPSDMMDGRIGLIRNELENSNFKNLIIISYAAKYASKMYSPFRDAVGSLNKLKSNKKTYQMNISNSDEAIREVALDIQEGADIIMIKPGLSYLDIIQRVKKEFKIPTFAYQVSGEYAMIKISAAQGIIDEKEIMLEQLISLKRAGADAILTYFAPQVSEIIRSRN
jgi:porphobilinogen synthase